MAALYRQSADGSGAAERLTTPAAGAIHTPQSWSPDGASLLFSLQDKDDVSLWVRSMRDGQTTRFGEAAAREASFSPDGRWVAYEALRGATYEVFVEPFPSTGAKYLIPKPQAGHPFWSPRGDMIIMNTGQFESTSVTFSATPQVRFGPPTPFPRTGRGEPNPQSERRNVDMMPDGQHVIGIGNGIVEDLPNQIQVVLNWFEELK
jgi:hypothetical protein